MEKVTLSIKNFVKGVNEWIKKKKKTQWHKDGYWLNQENPPPKKIKLSDKIVLMMQKDPTKSVSKIHCLSKVIARKMFHLANKWSLSSLMPSLSFLAILFLFLLTVWVGPHSPSVNECLQNCAGSDLLAECIFPRFPTVVGMGLLGLCDCGCS